MQIICVNGPPRAGKDTIVKSIHKQMVLIKSQPIVEKFAYPLNAIAQATAGMDNETFALYREKKKDDPLPNYDNVTMRDLLIYVSENFCKVLFGDDFFAIQAFNRLLNVHPINHCALFSDSGFQLEYDMLKSLVAKHNIGTVKLLRVTRDGCNYDNDSREYVEDEGNRYNIENNGSFKDLDAAVQQYLVKEVL